MNKLPQELVDWIVNDVGGWKSKEKRRFDRLAGETVARVASLAVLTRNFQHAVEELLFSSLAVGSSDFEDLERFLTGPRRQYLKKLTFVASIATLTPKYPRELEILFSTAIVRLYEAMVLLERQVDDEEIHVDLKLSLQQGITYKRGRQGSEITLLDNLVVPVGDPNHLLDLFEDLTPEDITSWISTRANRPSLRPLVRLAIEPSPEIVHPLGSSIWMIMSGHYDIEEQFPAPDWALQDLQSLLIRFNDKDPLMQPYFERVRYEQDAETVGLFPRVGEDVLGPLLWSFAHTCRNIPQLKIAMLTTSVKRLVNPEDIIDALARDPKPSRYELDDIERYVDADWGIYYAAPGFNSPFFVGTPLRPSYGYKKNACDTLCEEDLEVHRLNLATHDWWPDENLEGELQAIRDEIPIVRAYRTDLWETYQFSLVKGVVDWTSGGECCHDNVGVV
ncbi:hypothetical protein GE09DRAFT_165962 [Coniochaeta sp. 2T2.1]|nr:hypothetical protein GE09DRAFT_165962 [Coniochaeta sp. 2T2.1]